MHVAKDLLRSSDLGAAAVPHVLATTPGEAFSRALNARPGSRPVLGGREGISSFSGVINLRGKLLSNENHQLHPGNNRGDQR